MSRLRAGGRWQSTACTTQVVVVRAPADVDVELRCGGHPMVEGVDASPTAAVDPAAAGGTLLGKRYGDAELGIELLCTRPGDGTLQANGRDLLLQQPRALPSSD